MLLKLRVSNYALIRSLEVDFARGLNIITGETGAGKSILLGALGLLTGKRAEATAVQDEKCVIEGEFELPSHLQTYFVAEDLDYQTPCIIRRELLPGGKSRAFVNDTPVNLKVLQELSTYLVDIHSQHEVFALSDPEFRLFVTDAFGQSEGDAAQFSALYQEWIQVKAAWQKHVEETELLKKEADYLHFRLDELEEAKLEEGEEERLDAELKTLSHAEEIKGSLHTAVELLDGSEENVLVHLSRIQQAIQRVASYQSRLPEQLERLQSVSIELKDIGIEMDDILSSIDFNPERLQVVNDRLALLHKLKKLHVVTDVKALLAIEEDLREKLKTLQVSDEQSAVLEKQVRQLEYSMQKLAEQLHKKRTQGATLLEKQIADHLLRLNMPHARFLVQVEALNEFIKSGADKVSFLFSANPGAEPQDIRKIASGGEMSRVMLAIKTVIAKLRKLPSLVFDEIDTGISGQTADLAGEMMRELSKDAQVMAITHLPQIASKGNAHFKVLKQVFENRTETSIQTLDMPQRIEEIARMLSGDKLLPEALSNAKALLGA